MVPPVPLLQKKCDGQKTEAGVCSSLKLGTEKQLKIISCQESNPDRQPVGKSLHSAIPQLQIPPVAQERKKQFHSTPLHSVTLR
jgi:hypothetical protein